MVKQLHPWLMSRSMRHSQRSKWASTLKKFHGFFTKYSVYWVWAWMDKILSGSEMHIVLLKGIFYNGTILLESIVNLGSYLTSCYVWYHCWLGNQWKECLMIKKLMCIKAWIPSLRCFMDWMILLYLCAYPQCCMHAFNTSEEPFLVIYDSLWDPYSFSPHFSF